jgi:hypothetical protein
MYESSSSIFNILTTIQAFQLVDKVSFHWLLTYLRPSLLDNEIPHRTKLRMEILEWASTSTVEGCVKERLQVSLVSFLMPACAHTMTLHSHNDRIHLVKSPLRSICGLQNWRPLHLNHRPLCLFSKRTAAQMVPQSRAARIRSL